jgi:hypothetical protein
MPTVHQKNAASARWVALTDAIELIKNSAEALQWALSGFFQQGGKPDNDLALRFEQDQSQNLIIEGPEVPIETPLKIRAGRSILYPIGTKAGEWTMGFQACCLCSDSFGLDCYSSSASSPQSVCASG